LKISVIVPVYNEETMISKCLDALINQDFPRDKYEIIVVNDGSTDGTSAVVEKYNDIRLINLSRNMGRIIARITGAENAFYDLILFIDSRCIAFNDLLTNVQQIAYQPLISGHISRTTGKENDPERNPYERVLGMFRLKYYYTQCRERKEYWIDEQHFNRSPKGTGCLFISKDLFLECQPDSKGRHVSDDTRILREVVKRKPILRHRDVRIEYHGRHDFKSAIKHIFYRGPLFQDYYLCRGGVYYKYFVASVIVGLALITVGIVIPRVWLYYGLAFVPGIFGVAFYLSRNVEDFFLVLFYFPLISVTFITGVLYGKLRSWGLAIGRQLFRKMP
jgi:glycosyltransferase involved in cell wall biosynthesis